MSIEYRAHVFVVCLFECGNSIILGLRICKYIKLKVHGCLKKLDEAFITTDSNMIVNGNLTVPDSILQRYGLSSSSAPNGLLVYGSAKHSDYSEVLRNIVFNNGGEAVARSFDVKVIIR